MRTNTNKTIGIINRRILQYLSSISIKLYSFTKPLKINVFIADSILLEPQRILQQHRRLFDIFAVYLVVSAYGEVRLIEYSFIPLSRVTYHTALSPSITGWQSDRLPVAE